MKKIILLLLFLVFAQVVFAQVPESNSSSDVDVSPLGTTPKSESFTLDDAPIEINLPTGYIFIDAQNSKNFLINSWGNTYDAVKNVVGMIIPGSTSSVEGFDKAWILSFERNVGHVNDSKAGDMGFSWIINSFNNSEEYKNTHFEWAWTPNYNAEHHRLTLPFLSIANGDTTLSARQYIFGNKDLILVEPTARLSEIKWLAQNNDKIADAISFAPGSKYEDFNESYQNYAYNSVYAFLKGIPATTTAPNGVASDESDEPSFNLLVITWIGKIALYLLIIMAILMIAVAITKSRKESSGSITRLGINVLLRIAVFGVVYLLILTFAIFLIWAGVWLTIYAFTYHISIRTLICIVGGWMIIGSFLYAIIRGLFIFHRAEYPNRLEISESEAPKLFSLIREVSEALGEKMPKHTYVSPEVNACVFYDKPFLSLFSPGRKNLEVGLGLLFGLNKQELKAVIAHEYGHFGQKSMRVGQVVSISYNIISNIVNSDGASYVRPILKKTFLYVQRGYMTLSRAMEYEADEKSAYVAGNEAAISALCKIEVISSRFNAYNDLLSEIYESKHCRPSSYWSGYEQFESICGEFDGIKYDSSLIVSAPLTKTPPSRVKLKDAWISHPLLEQRIDNICRNKNSEISIQNEDSRDLVRSDVYKQTSEKLMINAGFNEGTVSSDQEYKELLAEGLAERSFPLYMRPFFSRDLCVFKISEESMSDSSLTIESVFSEENTLTMESITQAISDYRTMMMFKNKLTSEKEIQYEGKVYTRKTVPVEKQLEIIKALEPKVLQIDKSVFSLAMSKASDKALVANAYDNIFFAQAAIRHINEKIIPLRDSVAKKVGSGGSQNEQAFKQIQAILLNFKSTMKELEEYIQLERLNPVMHVNEVEYLKRVDSNVLLDGDSITGEEMQYIFTLPDRIIYLFQNLEYYSKKIVSDTIEGKSPLLYWNNSVAAQENKKQ